MAVRGCDKLSFCLKVSQSAFPQNAGEKLCERERETERQSERLGEREREVDRGREVERERGKRR